jgi:hypothetical protein
VAIDRRKMHNFCKGTIFVERKTRWLLTQNLYLGFCSMAMTNEPLETEVGNFCVETDHKYNYK